MKRIIVGVSNVFLLIFIIWTMLNTKTIYIPEIGFEIDSYVSVIVCVMITLLWMMLPIRKVCSKKGYVQGIYNFMPVLFFTIIFFAQYHFKIAAVLLILVDITIVYALYLLFSAFSDDGKKVDKSFKNRILKKMIFKIFGLLIVPCLISIFYYKMEPPSYEIYLKTDEKENISADTNYFEVYNSVIQCFKEENWTTYNFEQKAELVGGLVEFESKRLGVPILKVDIRKLDLGIVGQYVIDSKVIEIDSEWLKNASSSEIIEVVCHESFHYYEHYLMENIDWSSVPTNTLYFEQIQDWKENERDYITSSSDYEGYINQPIERDAYEYGRTETEEILLYLEGI